MVGSIFANTPSLQAKERVLSIFLRKIAFGAVILLFGAYGGLRASALLFHSKAVVGNNGYYYVLQTQSVLKNGQLYYPTRTPVTFYLLAAFSWITGDAISGVKIGTLTFAVMTICGAFFSVQELLHSRWCSALALALLAESTIGAYILVEYAKSLLALAFVLWGFFFALRACRSCRWGDMIAAGACVIASLASHRSMWIILPAVAVSLAISLFLFYDSSDTPRLWLGIACIGAASIWPVLPVLQPWFHLPPSVTSEISLRPQWPITSFAMPERLLLLIAATGVFLSLFSSGQLVECTKRRCVLGAGVMCCFLIPLNPFLNRGLGSLGGTERISGIIVVAIIPILAPALLWEAASRLNAWIPSVLSAVVLLLGAVVSGIIVPEGARPEYLAVREEQVRFLQSHRDEFRHCSMVLARHGEQFLVTDVTAVHSQRERPDDAVNVCWLVHSRSTTSLPEQFVLGRQQDGAYLELIPDDQLRLALGAMSTWDRSVFIYANPHVSLRM